LGLNYDGISVLQDDYVYSPNDQVSQKQFYIEGVNQIMDILSEKRQTEIRLRSARNVATIAGFSAVLFTLLLCLVQKFTFCDMISIFICPCSQSKILNIKAILWSLLITSVFWFVSFVPVLVTQTVSIPFLVIGHLVAIRLCSFLFESVKQTMSGRSWQARLKYAGKLVWTFVYSNGKVDQNGSGMNYLVRNYLVCWAVGSLLLVYIISGFYGFIIPTENKLLPVVFYSSWTVSLKRIDFCAMQIAVSFVLVNVLLIFLRQWTDFDYKKQNYDKIFLLRVVKDNRGIRSKFNILDSLKSCFGQTRVFKYIMLQDISTSSSSSNASSVIDEAYEAFSAEQKYIVLSQNTVL